MPNFRVATPEFNAQWLLSVTRERNRYREQRDELREQFRELVADHSVALEFVRELAALSVFMTAHEKEADLISRARAWLHTERRESATSADAVDPQVGSTGTLSTRDKGI